MSRTDDAIFLGYDEIEIYEGEGYHTYNIYFEDENIYYSNHLDVYIPPCIYKSTFILYMLYDFELTLDGSNQFRPHKVIYTDFYFKALQEGIRKNNIR